MSAKTNNMTLRLPDVLDLQLKAVCNDTGVSKHQLILDYILSGLQGQQVNIPSVQVELSPPKSLEPMVNVVPLASNEIQETLSNIQAQLLAMHQTQQEQAKEIKELKARKEREAIPQFKVGEKVTQQSTVRYQALAIANGVYQKDKYGANQYAWVPELCIVAKYTIIKSGRRSYSIIAVNTFELEIDDRDEDNLRFVSPKGNVGYDEEVWAKEQAEIETAKNKGVPKLPVPEGMHWVAVSVFDKKEFYSASELHDVHEVPLEVLANARQVDVRVFEAYIKGEAVRLHMDAGVSLGDETRWVVDYKLQPIDYKAEARKLAGIIVD